MYELDNISFSDYGIIPGQISGSNIALSGWLDMPKRLGKTYHEWGDETGIEPYVDENDIYFEGRDITFKGFIKYDNTNDLDILLNRFYGLLNDFKELVYFKTPYGAFKVYVNKEIKTKIYSKTVCELTIVFRQPKVVVPLNYFMAGYFSSEFFASMESNPIVIEYQNKEYDKHGIDGIPFGKFGAFLQSSQDTFNRATPQKGSKINNSQFESYHITKPGVEKIKFTLIFLGKDMDDLRMNVNALHVLLAKEGVRAIQIDDRLLTGFCVDGYKVKNIRKSQNLCVATCDVELIQISKRMFQPNYFQTGYFQ